MKSSLKGFLSLALQGFLALLPLIVSLYIGALVLSLADDAVSAILPLFPGQLAANAVIVFAAKLLVLFIFICLLAVFGLTVRSLIGRAGLGLVRNVISRIPGLGVVYKATEQVISVAAGKKSGFFVNPVLVEYPSAGIWAVAFNTGVFDQKQLGEETQYSVFIPTTPNPTSGFLAIVGENRIRKFPSSVEDAVKLVLTGGLVKTSSV